MRHNIYLNQIISSQTFMAVAEIIETSSHRRNFVLVFFTEDAAPRAAGIAPIMSGKAVMP
jgi:hypothetical protein